MPSNLADATDTSPQTTPDNRTGLSKRVSLRKARSPTKQQSSPTKQIASSPPKTIPSSPPWRQSDGPAHSSLPGSPQQEDSFGESQSEHHEDESSQGPSNTSEQDDSHHELPPHPQSALVSEGDYSLPHPHASHPNVNFTDEDIGVMHQRFGETKQFTTLACFHGARRAALRRQWRLE